MKQRLRKLLARALADLANHGTLPVGHDAAAIHIDRARRKGHGDFASNVALTLADKASLPHASWRKQSLNDYLRQILSIR